MAEVKVKDRALRSAQVLAHVEQAAARLDAWDDCSHSAEMLVWRSHSQLRGRAEWPPEAPQPTVDWEVKEYKQVARMTRQGAPSKPVIEVHHWASGEADSSHLCVVDLGAEDDQPEDVLAPAGWATLLLDSRHSARDGNGAAHAPSDWVELRAGKPIIGWMAGDGLRVLAAPAYLCSDYPRRRSARLKRARTLVAAAREAGAWSQVARKDDLSARDARDAARLLQWWDTHLLPLSLRGDRERLPAHDRRRLVRCSLQRLIEDLRLLQSHQVYAKAQVTLDDAVVRVSRLPGIPGEVQLDLDNGHLTRLEPGEGRLAALTALSQGQPLRSLALAASSHAAMAARGQVES